MALEAFLGVVVTKQVDIVDRYMLGLLIQRPQKLDGQILHRNKYNCMMPWQPPYDTMATIKLPRVTPTFPDAVTSGSTSTKRLQDTQ